MKQIYERILVTCTKCENVFETSTNRIATGRGKFCSKSCSTSSQHKKHGHAKRGNSSKTYSSWMSMRQRCGNPQHHAYPQYGGKGITVSLDWCSFDTFLADMGERPKGTSIDRIDSTLGYFKNNCRWATRSEQQANISSNIHLVYQGKTYILAELARHLKVSWTTLKYRINAGWLEEKWGKPTIKT